ncbi:MAG: IS21-like element helper ATPase IstB [Bacilli bacterium]
MIEELNKNLDKLELERIKEILPDYIHKNNKNMPPLTESLNYLINEEINFKNKRAAEDIIKASGIPFRKTLEDYDFTFQPSVNEMQIKELNNLSFIEQHENIVFIGNPGVGKTHLAVSIGMEAAKHRNSVYFITCHNLMQKLNKAQKENRLAKQLQHLAQYKVLIIDEIGYLPVDHQGSNLLFQLIAKRYMTKSTIVTTNMPFSRWGEVFSDNTLASAVLDRLLHYSHIIRITGNSYRIKDKIVESDSRTNEYNE